MPEGSCDPVGGPALVQAPARTCGPVERGPHAGAGLLAGLVTLKQPVPEGLHPVGRTHAWAVCEELQPVGRTHVGEVCGELTPMRATSRWSTQNHRITESQNHRIITESQNGRGWKGPLWVI